jgi:hypothetical protein
MGTKPNKWRYNRPNGHKIHQNRPFQDSPKFTQIGIFVLKIPKTSGNPVSVVILGNIPENYSQPERRLI